VGFAEGMGAQDVLHSIQNGIGGTLGGLAMILGFGAMLGRLISALFYMTNMNFIYFILLFEHYPNFKLKIFVYIVAIHIAYYGCNG
ncbi:hypothetical protein MJM04_28920, partial [Salmonella enterica subsp. enterica serovar Cerro]|nr:hypothetical protein [Salmonella enterica subsp. enterica serovar Cerro]